MNCWPLVVALSGCAATNGPALGQSEQPIELAQASSVFALSSQLLGQRNRDSRQRELASLATGALFVPFVDAQGAPSVASNSASLRATCGITFVTPSFAITAGHCVDATRMDISHLTAKMFRPTAQLTESYLVSTALTGSYPNFEHPRLSALDGYLVDEFPCTLIARCSDKYGGWLACDSMRDGLEPADVALIRCSGTPGSTYETLPVAVTDAALAAVFVPWKHEIYDVAMDPEDDRFIHYARSYEDPGSNFHYFGQDPQGQQYNQLLPLISIPFPDGTQHQKVTLTDIGVITDLFGCHGTSGSGVLQAGSDSSFELLGPIILGNHELESYLCNHAPSYDGFSRNPGSLGLTYGHLSATRALLAEHEADLALDCADQGDAVASRFAPRPCGLQPWLGAVAASTLAMIPLGAAPQVLDAEHPMTLDSVPLRVGARYRVGLLLQGDPGCLVDCPAFSLSLKGRELLSTASAVTYPGPSALAAPFVASDVQSGLIALRASGGGTLSVAALAIVEDGKPIGFDTAVERRDIQLIDVMVPDAGPTSLRVEGDDPLGFTARVEAGERLVFTRQALLPGLAMSAKFEVSSNATLSCGLLSPSGTVLSRHDCSTGFVRLEPLDGAATAAFYIENGTESTTTTIDNVRLASGAMPDGDGDGIPDVVDDCPRGPLPAVGELTMATAAPDLVRVCTPGVNRIGVTPPILANACDPATLVGSVSAIDGMALPEHSAQPGSKEETWLLPNGSVTVAFGVLDQFGRLAATLDKRVFVLFEPTGACCSDTQKRILGSSADETFDYSVLGNLCAITGNGVDFVASGKGTNYIATGSDADFLTASGEFDILIGGDGDDCIAANSIRAEVYAGPGNDTIHAVGAGSAQLSGGPGRDVIVGSPGPDVIIPGSGGDWVDAGAGDDTVTLYASCEVSSQLRLYGGAGADLLRTPLSEEALRQAGVVVDGFESIVFDDTLAYFSDCFAGGAWR